MEDSVRDEDSPGRNLRAFILDPSQERGEALCHHLQFLEYDALPVDAGSAQKRLLDDKEPADVLLIGPCRVDNGLLELFRRLRQADPHLAVIHMHSGDTPSDEQAELEAGCVASITVPVRFSELQGALQQAVTYRENRKLTGRPRSVELFRNLVGSSGAIREVRRLIEQVARTDARVLLLGESGTGKEVVARHVHYQSDRRYKPFVPVNCGAIPSELLESELFGHERGAFTGAVSARRGRFEIANGGSLFLDEIGDMPLNMQVKLLRVLQERSFERVGSNRSVQVDVRIIAATHSNLEEAIVSGEFREDLFYRLNVFPIEMPPLRQRSEDLPLLVSDLISRIEHEHRGSIRLTEVALQMLQRYPWPGNVRELANLMERLVILFPNGVVDADDLPSKYRSGKSLPGPGHAAGLDASPAMHTVPALPREGLDLKEYLAQTERLIIRQALDSSDGVVAHAAKLLNLGRTTLVEKMKKLDIQRPDEVA
jgi:sigma-54 specific flagellar transcriptional regulator A